MKNKSFILIGLLPFTLTSCLFGGVKKYNDKNDYYEFLEKSIDEADFHSELYIFPHEVKLETIDKFIYQTQESLFTGSFYIYLVVTYNEEEFNNELNRLDNVKATFAKTTDVKPIIKYEDKDLYLTINKDARYEYVKYDKENKEIAYISNQLFNWDQVEINENHLLEEITIPKELDDGKNSYNMYYSYQGDIGYYIKD